VLSCEFGAPDPDFKSWSVLADGNIPVTIRSWLACPLAGIKKVALSRVG